MYNMDGSSPSGFTNSTFCGMSCSTLPSPAPTPTPTPTVVDYSKVVVKSLGDVFAKAKDFWSFCTMIWYNMWVFFVWF